MTLPQPLSPEQIEAETFKYSSSVIHILPLESGAYAIFDARRQLSSIIPGTTTLAEIAPFRAYIRPVAEVPQGREALNTFLKELEL